jgi:hypothetical protein
MKAIIQEINKQVRMLIRISILEEYFQVMKILKGLLELWKMDDMMLYPFSRQHK